MLAVKADICLENPTDVDMKIKAVVHHLTAELGLGILIKTAAKLVVVNLREEISLEAAALAPHLVVVVASVIAVVAVQPVL